MNDYRAEFSFDPAPPKSGEQATLSYVPQTADGEAVTDLDVVHERLSHLIIASSDLSHFDHVHAQRRSGGAFALDYAFPAGGEYVLFADFTPKATGETQVFRRVVFVEGDARAHEPLAPQREAQASAGAGLRATLRAEPDPLRAGAEAVLTVTVRGEDDQPAEDLQPYLGAGGHMAIISEDTEAFLHAHPLESGRGHEDHGGHASSDGGKEKAGGPGAFGPELAFHTSFPRPGRYKIWVQVKRNEAVHTFPFVVEAAG